MTVSIADIEEPSFGWTGRDHAAIGVAGISQDQNDGLFNSMATQQAAQLGVNDLFYLSAAIFVASIALIWITKPERSGGEDSAAADSAAH